MIFAITKSCFSASKPEFRCCQVELVGQLIELLDLCMGSTDRALGFLHHLRDLFHVDRDAVAGLTLFLGCIGNVACFF